MAPMITAVEFTLSPREAIKMAKILSHPLRSEIHRKIFAFGFGAIWHCRQCPYRKHVAAFGVPDHPVIYLSDLSDQARPAVESDSLSQQTDF